MFGIFKPWKLAVSEYLKDNILQRIPKQFHRSYVYFNKLYIDKESTPTSHDDKYFSNFIILHFESRLQSHQVFKI